MRRQVAGLAAGAALFWLAVADRGTGVSAQGSDAGPFQACLQAQAKQWFDAKVELIANADPAAGTIDDTAVAGWTVEAINTCPVKAGGGAAVRALYGALARAPRRRGGGPQAQGAAGLGCGDRGLGIRDRAGESGPQSPVPGLMNIAARDRLIVALDFPEVEAARGLVA